MLKGQFAAILLGFLLFPSLLPAQDTKKSEANREPETVNREPKRSAQDTEKPSTNPEPGTVNREPPRNAQNLLAASKSPYLLQHADNPVHWHPWGDEAFALAKKENKPVFLSIGYSTCHWCHVMAHESFEDQETADFLNEHFISVKLDREERPDVDRIYMSYQQAVHGNGGWPLSLWLTPDRVPFFSGTYFPKDSGSRGATTFMDILGRIRESWSQYHSEISADSTRILDRLAEVLTAAPAESTALDPALADRGYADLVKIYDPENAGFGGAPKFPQPVFLSFLLEYHAALDRNDDATREARDRSLAMVHTTLQKMYLGGIHDHLGGGFHRYSVDGQWHVPHFEKMLYDQAQIASAAIDAYHLTRNPLHRDIALDIFKYIERDLSHPSGAFYSAEDADSLVPQSHHALAKDHDPTHKSDVSRRSAAKTEGAFYLWTHDEITGHLGPDDAPVFLAAYDVQKKGNVPAGSDPFGEFTDRNILRNTVPIASLAKTFDKTEADLAANLDRSREKLLAIRAQRPRPQLDDKILTAENGLMISAYAKAHIALNAPDEAQDLSSRASLRAEEPALSLPKGPHKPPKTPESSLDSRATHDPNQPTHNSPYLQRAARAATFIRDNLYDPRTKTLLRTWRDGPSEAGATADDYAFFIHGLLDLHDASLDIQWLSLAIELQDRQLELLLDDQDGGFFDAPAAQTDLILRLKSLHDGALPSANAISAQNLIRLGALVKSERYQAVLDGLFRHFSAELSGAPISHAALLTAWARQVKSPAQILLVGDPDDPATIAVLAQIRSRYLPGDVLLLLPPGGPRRDTLNALNPLFTAFAALEGRPTLYLCRNFTCQKPTSDPAEIAAQLDAL